MPTIERSIYLNTIEPAALSFRAASGMETLLEVVFKEQNGSFYPNDLAAQLQLSSRSTGRTLVYTMPAVDLVNGKARATIPADDLADPNGYQLRLLGTLNGQPQLLATGMVRTIISEGLKRMPLDTIDQIELEFERDEAVEIDLKLWMGDAKIVPFDLTATGTTVVADVYLTKGGTHLMPFTTSVLDTGEVLLTLTADQVNLLPETCWWSIGAATASGLTTLAEGPVTIVGTATPPLVEFIANYDYQKPDLGEPFPGQIIHPGWTRDLLHVANVDNNATDRTAQLALVRVGDEIVLGLTTWTVVRVDLGTASYRTFAIAPVEQAGVVGVQAVTFRRPEA